MMMQQRPEVILIPQLQPTVDNTFKQGSITQMKILSGIQIAMGGICMVMGIILIPLDVSTPVYGSEVSICGYGIWLGAMFIGLGIMGIRATKSKDGCMINAAMTLNIIFSAFGTVTFITLTAVALIITSENRCSGYSDTVDVFITTTPLMNTTWDNETTVLYYQVTDTTMWCEHGVVSTVFFAFDGLMLIMALIEFVINIWIAVLCCKAVCRCCKRNSSVGMLAHFSVGYTPNVYPQSGPMLIYPSVPQNYSYGHYQQQPYYPSGMCVPGYVGPSVTTGHMSGEANSFHVTGPSANPATNQNTNPQNYMNRDSSTVDSNGNGAHTLTEQPTISETNQNRYSQANANLTTVIGPQTESAVNSGILATPNSLGAPLPSLSAHLPPIGSA